MSKVTVYFLLQHPQDLEDILSVLDAQFRDADSPLMTGISQRWSLGPWSRSV